ncbi:M4 family metallopeptidase [Streptomyces sp. NPDC050085]|uniref:M4 family metallopeptidase n=1 Tax=Streptomyces sp. NPDC050085 TaxID=3365600 RepID=UPI0037BD454A
MDSTLVAALIGTAGGGAATGLGAWFRGRGHTRTALRLVYAELTRHSSSVVQLRQLGRWLEPPSRSAWDRHSGVLARLRRSEVFGLANRGYEALDLAAHATEDGLSAAERDVILETASQRLAEAIRAVGTAGRMPEHEILSRVSALEPGARATGSALLPPGIDIRPGGTLLPGAPAYVVRDGTLELSPGAGASDLVRHVVFDAAGGTGLDGLRPVRWSGRDAYGDDAVDTAYEALVAMDRFGTEVLGLAPDEATRRPYAAVVHYGRGHNNGTWSGQFLYLGDGDGVTFDNFSRLDVVAAEGWQRLPAFARFTFSGRSGSLHVAIRDVLAALTRQYALEQSVDEADWLLADGLVLADSGGNALRSLKAPGEAYENERLGKDPQVRHFRDFMDTERDTGGIRLNSGIPAHAFYRLAMELGGHAWERAGLIWWDALSGELPDLVEDFTTWARATDRAAESRFGTDSDEHKATKASWEAVGVPLEEREEGG